MKFTIKTSFSLLVLSLLFLGYADAQQGYSYSQYMNNLTPLNSASARISGSGSVNLLARKQWVGIEGSPSTVIFNGSLAIPSLKSSAGLIISNDITGIEKRFETLAFFAKSVAIAQNTQLSVSLNLGVSRLSANYNELDANDPKFRDNFQQTSGLTGIGLLLHSDKFYAGISVPRISLQKGTSTQRLKPNYYAMGGYLFDAAPSIKIKPALLFSYVPGLPLKTDGSVTLYLKEQLGIGANYGSNKEMSGIVSYFFKNNIGLGYSYQFAAGAENLGSGTNSTQEVSLSYRFGAGKKGMLLL